MKVFIFVLILVSSFSLFSQDFNQLNINNLNSSVIAVGDFNNDGFDDIFGVQTVSSRDNIYLYLNRADSTISFQEIIISENRSNVYSNASAADYDNDGDLDVLLSFGDDFNMVIFENQGDNSFIEKPLELLGSNNHMFVDFDNDGDMDIVGSNSTTTSINFYTNTDNTFAISNTMEFDKRVISFDMEDIDNDGDKDIIICHGSFSVPINLTLLLYADGVYSEHIFNQNSLADVVSVIITDINDDQFLDICILADDGFYAWFNNANLDFNKKKLIDYEGEWPKRYRAMDIADFNGDKINDIALSDSGGPLLWFKNTNLTPNEYEGSPVGINHNSYFISHADFDLDGDIDIVGSQLSLTFYENDITSSIDEINLKANFISIHPNPTKGFLNITSTHNLNGQSAKIFNTSGQLIITTQVLNNTINLSTLKVGVYFLEIEGYDVVEFVKE